MAVGTSVVLFIGVQHVRSGQLTLGQLLMVMAYLEQVYGPLKMVTKRWLNCRRRSTTCPLAINHRAWCSVRVALRCIQAHAWELWEVQALEKRRCFIS